ncbi:MAG: hypothetical protein CM15mP51_14660 [Porticoccaceae bacterium]|nr:MAG: hypothetical protein CM15mP51_14660 [Porticoccaceae bacterium]
MCFTTAHLFLFTFNIIRYCEREKISIFGVVLNIYLRSKNRIFEPVKTHRLEHMHTILSTGSPLTHGSFQYIYRCFNPSIQLSSISGGTDILSAFVAGNPVCQLCRRDSMQNFGYGRPNLE